MFKQYLKVQPIGIQFTIFLTIWVAFSLIFTTLQPIILHNAGIKSGDLDALYKSPNLLMMINALVTLFLFFIPAVLFAYLSDPKPSSYLGLIKPKKNIQWLWVIILAIGLILAITSIGGWIKELNLGSTAKALDEERARIFKTYLAATNTFGLLKNLFFLSLLPAVAEELFFRGIIQKFAYSWTKKSHLAIFISGFVFAIMHFSIYEFIPILIAGFILAWVYYITSSIILSMFLHFLNNGLQVILVFIASKNPAIDQLDQNTLFVILFAIAGFSICSFALLKLNKNKTPLPFHWDVRETMILNKEL